jgi:sialate O-acetylesterase
MIPAFPRFALLLLSTTPLLAVVKLASPFGDHMVLQQGCSVPVWGTAAPHEKVTIEFAGQKESATADPSGEWHLALKQLPASTESRRFMASGSATPAPLEFNDVLVGEVWLCSGQSNMDFTVAKTAKYYFAGVNNEAAEVAAANFPFIRMFTGEWAKSAVPVQRVGGSWKICTPETVREFSAIGYFFARDLQRELNVPIGIVTLTYGASCAQAWLRRDAIAANPRLKPQLDEFDLKVKNYLPPTAAELAAWQMAVDKAKAAGQRPPRRPKPDPAEDQHNPTVMFNGMIAPVVPYAIRGVLWYQGESITAPRELFPLWNEALIRDWRALWGSELPFYFCQLAAHRAASNGPEVRAWQTAALALPGTAMAVTIDIGDEKNVHPKNKQDVGARLARIALARNYGRTLEYSGPQFESLTVAGGTLRLKFSHATGGLVAKAGPLQTFEIAASDGRYVPAAAQIDGDTLVVRSDAVLIPASARYAWSAYPEGCNLFNRDGLPAAPFRTDSPLP